jgi:hypothetical protein
VERYDGDPAVANDFGRRTLHDYEDRALYEAGYMASLNMWSPCKWMLRARGIPLPPEPRVVAREAAIHQHYYGQLTPHQCADTRWDLNNHMMWNSFFRQRWEMKLAR